MKTTIERIDDIVLDLENEAENENYHSYCRMYRQLADILLKKVSKKDTFAILKEIKKQNGFLP